MPSVPGVLNYPAVIDDAISLISSANNAATTLDAPYTSGNTTLTVVSNTLLTSSGLVTVGEAGLILRYTGKSGSTGLTGVTRADVAQEPNNPADTNVPNGQIVEQRATSGMFGVLRSAILQIEALLAVRAAAAQSGALRMDNAQWLTARNAANNADLNLLRANASDQAEMTPLLSLLAGLKIAASQRLNFVGQAGDVSSPQAGDVWYDTTAKSFRRQAGLGPIGFGGLLYANTADDALASGGTAELKFASQIALAAAGLTVGKVLRVRIKGTYTTDATAAQTFTVNVKLGAATNATSGTTVATTQFPATASLTNANWSLDVDIVIRSVTTAWGAGQGTVGSTVAAPWTAATVSVSNGGGVGTVTTIPNISGAQTVHATAIPNDTGMTITLRTMTVEVLS